MKAIFQFENYENVAKQFRVHHLEPKLSKIGLLTQTKIVFQDYVNRSAPAAPPLKPAIVASQAVSKWEDIEPAPEKTIWVLDLDATGGNTPDSSYGLCVLVAMAEKQFSMNIDQFLKSRSFLTVILTLYPDSLPKADSIVLLPRPSCDLGSLHKLWPNVKKIQNGNPSRVTSPEIDRAFGEIEQEGPRIILANRGGDEAWLAELAVKWLA